MKDFIINCVGVGGISAIVAGVYLQYGIWLACIVGGVFAISIAINNQRG